MNKTKILRTAVAMLSAVAVTVPLAACGSKGDITSNTADANRTFTYFIPKQDGVGVGGRYDAYDQNPSIMYLTKDPFTYKTASKSGSTYTQGDEVTNKVALRFESATSGQEQNGFITNLNNGVDILDMEYAPETARTMFNSGKILDLTYWVENYMPNYLAYAEKIGYSDLIATRDENGKKQYLQLYSMQDNVYRYWFGYQYRRDWVLKYGKVFDTETGAIGTQTFAAAHPDWGWNSNKTEWNDGIIFPSWYGLQYSSDGTTGTFKFDQELKDYMQGTYKEYSESRATSLETELSHLERDYETYHGQWPATISDWEWMLDIFKTATKSNNNGYAMSLYQSGYIAAGNIMSSFGGTSAEWQKAEDQSKIVFGGDESAFKVYVDTMNKWYSKGWIDTQFQAHADLMWRTDEQNVRKGNVGLFFGMDDQLYNGMEISAAPNTVGICSMGLPLPINDKYGAAENKYKIPYTFYSLSNEVNSIVISKACETNGKDLAALFTMLDKTYTPEMATAKGWGLTDSMLAEMSDGIKKLYKTLGYPNGTTIYDSETDAYYKASDALNILIDDQYIVSSRRMFGLEGFITSKEQVRNSNYEEYIWNFFPDKGYLTKSFYAQFNADQYALYNDKVGQMRNSLAVDIPKYVKGINQMSNWDSWFASLKSNLGIDNITRMLNNKYQEMRKDG